MIDESRMNSIMKLKLAVMCIAAIDASSNGCFVTSLFKIYTINGTWQNE